jgi:hypothetical protein
MVHGGGTVPGVAGSRRRFGRAPGCRVDRRWLGENGHDGRYPPGGTPQLCRHERAPLLKASGIAGRDRGVRTGGGVPARTLAGGPAGERRPHDQQYAVSGQVPWLDAATVCQPSPPDNRLQPVGEDFPSSDRGQQPRDIRLRNTHLGGDLTFGCCRCDTHGDDAPIEAGSRYSSVRASAVSIPGIGSPSVSTGRGVAPPGGVHSIGS